MKKNILGIGITDALESEILEFVVNSLLNNTPPYYIVTPNPEMIAFASTHPDFKSSLNGASISLCDGVGLFVASKILNKPIKERITGTDFMEKLCEKVSNKLITVGFLGAGTNVAEKTAERLQKKYPNLRISHIMEEWQEINSKGLKKKGERIRINSKNYGEKLHPSVDILFVAFGFPKQEEWMQEHVGRTSAKVMVGVGGAFDYISGNVNRAPKWIRKLGLEWLFRLVIQPWRWKRQLALLEFVRMAVVEKLKS